MVILKSCDGHTFGVDAATLKCSELLQDVIKNLKARGCTNQVIPLPTVTGNILKMIIKWAVYHKNDPPPPPPAPSQDAASKRYMCKWDRKFINVDMETLADLILAANELNIKGLVDLACKSIASRLEGKSAEEMWKIMKLRSSFGEAEKLIKQMKMPENAPNEQKT